jgi:hypothetical protein
MDPSRVQRVQPKADMNALRIQLNKSKYRSVTCKFGDPVFVSLDASAGTATVDAELKQVFEYTSGNEKPQTFESIAQIPLRRFELRSPWVIAGFLHYKPKPK